jgi:hypothetical protein
LKILKKEPFGNIYNHAEYFLRSNSLNIQNIVNAFLEHFEREQAAYISKLYSRITVSTLLSYLGDRYTDLNDYLGKYSWRIDNDGQAVTTKKVAGSSNYDQKAGLSFLNEMTVMMENISKTNSLINVAK